jgi:hypothetical protein
MAAVLLALRLYQFDHDGRLPRKLEELSPAYLPAVPIDPFAADGRSLGWLPDAAPPRVYSVGQNGTDEMATTGGVGGRTPFFNRYLDSDVVLFFEVKLPSAKGAGQQQDVADQPGDGEQEDGRAEPPEGGQD